MMPLFRAFIPSAGHGERLLPITRHLPKPLMPVLGLPVIERVMTRLVGAGVREVGINTHHLAERLENWVSRSHFRPHVRLFRETALLGTGGGLINAADFLRSAPFIVYNGDVLCDLDVSLLIRHHARSGNLVTLVVHDCPAYNRLRVDTDGFLAGLVDGGKPSGSETASVVAFTGIAAYEPMFLDYLPAGVSHVVPSWLHALAHGQRIGTLKLDGLFWSDLGTAENYARAVFHLLDREGESVYLHPGSSGCDGAVLKGHVVMEEGATVGRGAVLQDVILLPGAIVPSDRSVREALVGPDYEVRVSLLGDKDRSPEEVSGSPLLSELGMEHARFREIGFGGSPRRYMRAEQVGRTCVLACCDATDPDFNRHIRYTEFFARHGVRVPQLLGLDKSAGLAAFEDLGDVSLYTWMKCRRPVVEVQRIYEQVLRTMALVHGLPLGAEPEKGRTDFRAFDFAHFRWESSYFLSEFINRHMKLALDNELALSDELDDLARAAAAFRPSVVHRDFQSQNVMLPGSGEPVLIDYQGARIGPPAYDLASLLWDPYVSLPQGLRESLVNQYLFLRKEHKGFDPVEFMQSLPACRIQRHMQALGAYAFLSNVRNKKRFLRFMEPAVSLVEKDLLEVSCPELGRLVARVRSAL